MVFPRFKFGGFKMSGFEKCDAIGSLCVGFLSPKILGLEDADFTVSES